MSTDYVAEPSARRRSRRFHFVGLTALLIAVLAMGALVGRSSQSSGESAGQQANDPSNGSSGFTDFSDSGMSEETQARLAEQIEDGWVPYKSVTFAEPKTAIEGYMQFNADPAIAASHHVENGTAIPVFDAPRGNLIGFEYGFLGFVDVETQGSEAYDAVAERVDRYGCDPLDADVDVRSVCTSRIAGGSEGS